MSIYMCMSLSGHFLRFDFVGRMIEGERRHWASEWYEESGPWVKEGKGVMLPYVCS